MKKMTLPQASRLTSPNPVTIVCTRKPDGSTNLATVSWWTYLSYNPDMVAFAMAKTSYSGERVRETKEVVITVPGASMAEIALGCGSTTGRDTDKAAKFSVELAALGGNGIQVPAHSRLAIQCHLKEFHEVGDHYLYICTVEQVWGDVAEDALFAWNGYSKLGAAAQVK